MTETVAVVKVAYALEEAYEKGHARFRDTELPEGAEPSLEGFEDSAEYANSVLPTLRCMAGMADVTGKGTYQENRKVAAINPGNEEDEPAEAELLEARNLFGELVDAYRTGALDGMEGTYDPDSVSYWV